MANVKDFSKKLKRYLIARIPFISIKSIERNRVLEAFSNLNQNLHLPIYVHTLSKGMYDLSNNNIINEDFLCYFFLTGSHVNPMPSFLNILRSTSLSITVE